MQEKAEPIRPVPRMCSVRDAAEVFGRSPRTIRAWIAEGVFDPVRVGRAVFIPWSQIEGLIASKGTSRSSKKQGRRPQRSAEERFSAPFKIK